MAHNLATRLDGTHMALYVGKPAWHELGEVLEARQTSAQIVRKVFGKRVVESVPAYAKLGGKIIEVPEFRALADVRGKQVFGYASPEFVPIQDGEALAVAEQIIKSKRKAIWSSAGALGNGARGFASIDLTAVLGADALAIKGDPSAQQAFLFVDWSHDGSSAVKYGRWRNRVDCNNMLDAANSAAAKSGRLARIIHRGGEQSMAAQVKEAEEVLGFVVHDLKLNTKFLNQLAAISLPKPDAWFAEFSEILVPIPEDMERKSTREETRDLLTALWQSSKTLVTVPKSPYRGLQVVAEYADHFRNLRVSDVNAALVPEKRFRTITEGPAADLKARAAELIRQEFEIGVKVK